MIFDDVSRSLHVKVYVRARRLSDACQVVHAYENNNQLLPMKTYDLLISCLFAQNEPKTRAIAWDMFAHMRYVAHPLPDAHLYSVMLRACASAPVPQAERALDLFTEMHSDHRIPLTRDVYNWTILACARAKDFTTEAFRLAQQMLNAHRDGNLELRPDLSTFSALLESAKRKGDLSRARWILAELIRATQHGDNQLSPDEDIMAHIFQVYAAYHPPFQREIVRRHAEDLTPNALPNSSPSPPSSSQDTPEEALDANIDPPQSHAEVIAEAQTLFHRIQEATPSATAHTHPLFAHVRPNTNLVNSYISVIFAHGSLSQAQQAFNESFAAVDVKRNPRSYLLAMQRCCRVDTIDDRLDAMAFARTLWEDWRLIESGKGMSEGKHPHPPSSRTIEKMWSTMIRILTQCVIS